MNFKMCFSHWANVQCTLSREELFESNRAEIFQPPSQRQYPNWADWINNCTATTMIMDMMKMSNNLHWTMLYIRNRKFSIFIIRVRLCTLCTLFANKTIKNIFAGNRNGCSMLILCVAAKSASIVIHRCWLLAKGNFVMFKRKVKKL